MSITLTPETQAMIESRMTRSGLGSPDDVVRAALEALDGIDPLAQLTDHQLDITYPGFRAKIVQGLAEADAGQLVDGETFFAELEQEEETSKD